MLGFWRFQLTIGTSPLQFASLCCGCSSMVELQPSKLVTWVRFPSPAPIPIQPNRIKPSVSFCLSGNGLLLTLTANTSGHVRDVEGPIGGAGVPSKNSSSLGSGPMRFGLAPTSMLTTLDPAQLARSWDTLENRKRVLRGRPLPGSLRPEKAKPKNLARPQALFTE